MNPINPTHLDYRAERVDKYFNPIPEPPSYGGPLALLIGGGVAFLIGIITIASAGSSGACIGLILFAGGIYSAYKGARPMLKRYNEYVAAKNLSEPRATDQEMTDWLEDGLRMAEDAGRHRLNLNPAEATIDQGAKMLVFTGLPDNDEFPVRLAVGDDRMVRSSYYKILVVFLSGYRLSTYECVLEMRSGATLTDATKEYHLQDVDGMETRSDRVNFELQSAGSATAETFQVTMRQVLRLMVAGRAAISLVMGMSGSASLRIDNTSTRTDIPGPDEMINTLREYLRSHKGGVLGNPAVMLPPQWNGHYGLPGQGNGQSGPEGPPMTPPHLGAPAAHRSPEDGD
jgi:hypothetical protein